MHSTQQKNLQKETIRMGLEPTTSVLSSRN